MKSILLPVPVVPLDSLWLFAELHDDLRGGLRQTTTWRLNQTLEAIVNTELLLESSMHRKPVCDWGGCVGKRLGDDLTALVSHSVGFYWPGSARYYLDEYPECASVDHHPRPYLIVTNEETKTHSG